LVWKEIQMLFNLTVIRLFLIMALEVGRIVLKVAGREAGRYAVILRKIDDNFVLITGPRPLTGVKRRRCNVEHLEPTEHHIEVKQDATDLQVFKAWEKAGLIAKLGLKKPPITAFKPPKKVEKPKRPPKKPKPKKPKAKPKKKPVKRKAKKR